MDMNNSWASSINAQPMFDILSKANIREKEGNYVARMEIGDTPGFRNEIIHQILEKKATEPHRYSPSKGEELLVQTLFETQWDSYSRDQYDISIAPANFLITAALAAVTSPGDTVLIPDPGFPTYKLACDFLRLNIVTYSLYPLEGQDFPNLSAFFNSETKPKVIILNNPSNPLGIAFEGATLEKELQVLQQSGIEIIIDETYVNLTYDGTNPIIPRVEATRIRSFSKEHCAPGLRIGYALANLKNSQSIANFISLSISCAPRFIQLAVAEYLLLSDAKEFTAKLRQEMKTRFEVLAKLLPESALLSKPNSAFYAMIETGNAENSFEFFLNRNVATCPGSRFGTAAKSALRISLAGKKETLEKDFELLQNAYIQWVKSK